MPLHDAILPHSAEITGMPTESCLMKTMAEGAGSGRRAVDGLTAGEEKEKTTERSNLHEMPTEAETVWPSALY
jgi:hypothetical protein